MAQTPQIVAIGLLTQHELDLLGRGFDRAFPLDEELVFEDLLRAIDEAEEALQSRHDEHAPHGR
ncbi:hypothetical protein LZ518_00420 [Sphingomonas sp. RB56-2]|uniref:DivIVA domain-containing protein n=1 Tax=Sphingomonas brevis TaxID=2908206 RepID=A0ABT0S5F3_9SPHN|nr:hypothetical protein [Sphingomonas brevis]MCL6739607.1 hypothetical protein [Sphingomonas brevis]